MVEIKAGWWVRNRWLFAIGFSSLLIANIVSGQYPAWTKVFYGVGAFGWLYTAHN